jgi:uncharacterized protein (TIGR03437 family)
MSSRICKTSGFIVLFLASLIGPATLHSQSSPAFTVVIRMAAGGPLAAPASLSIGTNSSSPVPWKASVSDNAPWIALSATSGTTPSTISIGVVDWRAEAMAPGTYTGQVTFTATGTATSVLSVIWTVVPRMPAPAFTYTAPPQGCSNPGGFPDLALCTVPDENPPGGFTPPPVGGSYTDPNFGANVKVLTPTGVYHTYSANNPLSAHNKNLMTFPADGSFNVIDAASGQTLATKVPANQNFVWDSDNDSVYYYLSGSKWIKHDLAAGADTTLVDYSTDGHKFTSIARGGTTGGSKDNWISFFAPTEKQVCALDLNAVKTYCADYGGIPGNPIGNVDYVLDSKGVDKATGKRYVILVAGSANPAIYSVNVTAGKLDLEYRGPEDPDGNGNHDNVCDPGEKCMYPSHSDTLEDSAGTQYLVYNSFSNYPCEVSTSTYQLNKGLAIMQPTELGGGRRKVMTLWSCPFPNSNGGTDDHVGCARKAPYCVISTVAPYRAATDPPLRFPHATEILVMRENGLEIRRLAESRSVRFKEEGSEAYWAEPRAAISNDGTLVIADSNFGFMHGVRVTMIRTGFNAPQPAAVNAAGLAPAIAPGGYATLFGKGLAGCTASADSLPLPSSLCGSSVTFNGIPAPITYASAQQINVLVPRSLGVGKDVAISVSTGGSDAPLQTTVPAANVIEAAPGIFSYSLADTIERAVVTNASYVLNGPKDAGSSIAPSHLGDAQIVWANALGPVATPVADGDGAPLDSADRTQRNVEVIVNGVSQTVQFSGLAPGFSGLYQVNFTLNSATPVLPEGSNHIWLRVNGVESRQLVISLQ